MSKKNNVFTFSTLIKVLDSMGMGVLATLIVGTILRQLAMLLGMIFSSYL